MAINNQINNTLSPAIFSIALNASTSNQTGDGTDYIIICDSVQVDTQSGYNTSTGVYTAVLSGNYVLFGTLIINGVNSTNTSYTLALRQSGASNIAILASGNVDIAGDNLTYINYSTMVPLSPGLPVEIVLTVNGALAPNVGLVGDGSSLPFKTLVNGFFIG